MSHSFVSSQARRGALSAAHGKGLHTNGLFYTQTSHPYLFSHQEPFSGKSDKYNQHLPNPRGCLHCQGTQNPAGLVGVRAPRSVGLPHQTATTRSFFPCMVVTHADFPAQLSIKFELSTIRKQTQSCCTSQEHNVRGSLRKGTAQKSTESTRSLGALHHPAHHLAPIHPQRGMEPHLVRHSTPSLMCFIKDRPLSLFYQILQTLTAF